MQTQSKKLPGGQMELTIELSLADFAPYLTRAATRLTEKKPLPGFRPGKAPLEMVIKQFGEMAVWEEASVEAVQTSYSQTVFEQKLPTIGSPKIEVLKLAPGNPFIYKTICSLLPEITLGNFSALEISAKPTEITEKNIEKTLDDLRKMQTKEVISTEPAKTNGKVVVDMVISLDKVPLEGGTTKDHAIYFNEDYYVPGLKEKLLNIKKGETREFKLPFAKEHFQKNLAGKEVNFQVTAKEVFELQPPALDDAFAQSLGQKNLEDARNLIRKNLEEEAKFKDAEKQENELLEKAADKTRFGEIPDILINEETHKMVHELQDSLEKQGLRFEEYLQKLGKKPEDLRLNFTAQALKRIKTALLLRQIILEQKIALTDQELDEEVEKNAKLYAPDAKMLESIHSPEARNWLANSLLNKKAIEFLKNQSKTK